MQKLFNKITAGILIAILLGFNCATTAVYAANIIEQNNETSEENITFDVKLGNESSHEGYEYTAEHLIQQLEMKHLMKDMSIQQILILLIQTYILILV